MLFISIVILCFICVVLFISIVISWFTLLLCLSALWFYVHWCFVYQHCDFMVHCCFVYQHCDFMFAGVLFINIVILCSLVFVYQHCDFMFTGVLFISIIILCSLVFCLSALWFYVHWCFVYQHCDFMLHLCCVVYQHCDFMFTSVVFISIVILCSLVFCLSALWFYVSLVIFLLSPLCFCVLL